MEEALYDSVAMRGFAGIDLGQEGAPDETTVCKFRHLLERHKLGEKLLLTVNGYLARNGIKISNGTIVDATVISAPSSTKNEDGQRDPQMNQTANGKQWYFGMTAHVGVDSRTKLVDPVPASAANVADFQALPHRLRGQTDASRSVAACARDYTNRLHRFGQRTGERVKAKILAMSRARANVEHSIGVIKQAFGFQKVRYRALAKNLHRLEVTAALANLFMVRRLLAV